MGREGRGGEGKGMGWGGGEEERGRGIRWLASTLRGGNDGVRGRVVGLSFAPLLGFGIFNVALNRI